MLAASTDSSASMFCGRGLFRALLCADWEKSGFLIMALLAGIRWVLTLSVQWFRRLWYPIYIRRSLTIFFIKNTHGRLSTTAKKPPSPTIRGKGGFPLFPQPEAVDKVFLTCGACSCLRAGLCAYSAASVSAAASAASSAASAASTASATSAAASGSAGAACSSPSPTTRTLMVPLMSR